MNTTSITTAPSPSPPPRTGAARPVAAGLARDLDFEAIVLPHEGVLRRTARYMTQRLDLAEDVLQETMLKAWRGLHLYDRSREARTWLLAILRRAVFDAARRRRRERGVVSLDEARPEGVPAGGPGSRSGAGGDPGLAALDAIERGEVLDAVARLPREFREVVRLVAVEERSYREVAERLAIPVGTVMSRLHRGRRILRERLAEYDPAAGGRSAVPPRAAA